MRLRIVVMSAALLVVASACGGAGARLWGTAGDRLPANTRRVVYVDVGALARAGVLDAVAEDARGMRGLAELKRCGLPLERTELVWALGAGGEEVAFLGVPRAERAPIEACLREHARASALSWLDGETVVFTRDGEQALAAMTGGAGALWSDEVFASGLLEVDWASALWVVSRQRERKEGPKVITMSASIDGKQISAEVVVPIGSWTKAVAMAYLMRKELEKERDRKRGGGERDELLDDYTVDAEGDKVVVRVYISIDALGRALRKFGLD